MRIIAPLISAAFLVAACAAMDRDSDQADKTVATCTTNPCAVTVTVTACNQIRTDPYFLKVPPGNRNDIEWTLKAPSNWKFTRDGIEFKRGPGSEFSEPKGGGSQKFGWKNNHRSAAQHDYNVNVTPDGVTVCRQDPSIMNN